MSRMKLEQRCTLCVPFRHFEGDTTTKQITRSYLVAVSCISVAEPLDIVEDKPGEGDDHENDEGDGDKHYRRSAHILLQVSGSYGDVDDHLDVSFQQGHNLPTFRLWDHDGHNVTCTWKQQFRDLEDSFLCDLGSLMIQMLVGFTVGAQSRHKTTRNHSRKRCT